MRVNGADLGDAIFTIPFPEYDIADRLQKEFLKKHNFSIAIPFSCQQKYYDLLLFNGDTRKSVTIQVKSSRTYVKHLEKSEYNYDSLLGHFDITDNYSDFYFVYMIYPELDDDFHPRATWERKILVFNKPEMEELLGNVQTKSGKQERFFSFGFNRTGDEIYGVRGFKHRDNREYTANLLDKKIAEVRSALT